MQKWEELNGLDLNGYTAYLREEVLVKGKPTHIYELTKGNYKEGFKVVRALFEELEILCRLNMINSNKYKYVDSALGKWSTGKN